MPACHGIFWYNSGIIASGGYMLGTLMHREKPENIWRHTLHSIGGVVIIAA
jgi:hypothetical protein